MKKVEIHNKNRIFNDFFKIDEATLSFEQYNGEMSPPIRRLNFERGDSVAALIFHRERESILLLEQFRYPTYDKGKGWIQEVVAGMVEQGEEPVDALKREIFEEMGYQIEEAVFIARFFVSPGGSSERIWLYYVEVADMNKAGEGGGLVEEHEDILIKEWPLNRFLEAVGQGEIEDAKTLVAGLWLLKRRK